MKIVIDIPEMAYEAYKEWHKNMVATVEESLIARGTPLPKGHGRLIDADKVRNVLPRINFMSYEQYLSAMYKLDNLPTVIEADKGADNDE